MPFWLGILTVLNRSKSAKLSYSNIQILSMISPHIYLEFLYIFPTKDFKKNIFTLSTIFLISKNQKLTSHMDSDHFSAFSP